MRKASDGICSGKALKALLSLVALLLFGAMPGYGQISFNAQEKHEQKMRKSLKEAEQVELAHKETHLNIGVYTFRKGAAARKRLKKDERSGYQFNESGKPVKWKKALKKKKYKRAKKK